MPDKGFALGGLAGNNFHGAGLLEAARRKNVRPRIISCTTGQIYWVHEYLKALKSGTSLRTIVETAFEEIQPTPFRDLALAYMLSPFGGETAHKKFRPAFPEWLYDFNANAIQLILETIKQSFELVTEYIDKKPTSSLFYMKNILDTLPARLLIPKMVLDEAKRREIAAEFNSTNIAIVFNSYDPVKGCERIHLNPAAQGLLGKNPGQYSSFRSYHRSAVTKQKYPGTGITRVYEDIDHNAVRDALWLYEYGFGDGRKYLDGAYLRGIILAEIAKAVDEIYVARPINHKWRPPLPRSFIERLDLQTEVFFNGSYFGELDRIMFINELLTPALPVNPKQAALAAAFSNAGFRPVTVKSIEIEKQRGFFDYLFEDIEVFEESDRRSYAIL